MIPGYISVELSALFKNRRDASYDYFFLENIFEKKMNIKGVKLIAI